MFKFRYLLFVFAAAFFCLSDAEAKVCFLVNADGSENCSEAGFVGETSCIGMGCKYCTRPRTGTSPCIEGQNCYHKEDCCDPQNGYDGEDCPEPKKCYTKTGQIVDGCPTGDTEVCPTNTVCRCPHKWISSADYYRLPVSVAKQYNRCDAPKVLGGQHCNDGDGIEKYESCDCPSEYSETCSDSLKGVGESCDNKYQKCVCDSKYNLKTPADCSHCTSCAANGQTLYYCTLNNPPTCRCRVKTDSKGCQVDCEDKIPENYDYIGKVLSNVSFGYQTDTLQSDGICGKYPCCTPGNWDKTEWCDASTCEDLGYTETSCGSRPFVGCPCDITKKKCLGGGNES